MATVYLVTTGDNRIRPNSADDYDRLTWASGQDRFQRHHRTEDPDAADLILFVGSRDFDLWDVRRHALVRKYREKCFLFHTADRIVPFLPGVYPTLDSRDNLGNRSRGAAYLNPFQMSDIVATEITDRCNLLFSFCGSVKTHPVRRELLRLEHPRGVILDTADLLADHAGGSWAPGSHRTSYAELLERSKFVLCPRGLGTSSWRLFETLKAGRVPVIVSDRWVPPTGVGWESFSVRVAEHETRKIPSLLEALESEAPSMGRLAAECWESYFSEEAIFNSMVEWCLDILGTRRMPERYGRWLAMLSLLRPYNFRFIALPRWKRLF